MARVSDQTIIDFATKHNCTNIIINRQVQTSGYKVIHVSFTCSCGRPGGKKWHEFTKNPMCKLCMKAANPRIGDDVIKQKVEENGCEFVGTRRTRNKKTRIVVSYICSCDKDTTRVIRESLWEVVNDGGRCGVCGNARRKASIIKAYEEHGKEIREKTEATFLERYGATDVMRAPEIANRIKNTNIERYGVANPFQNKEIQQKAKEKIIEKYGVSNVIMIPEIKERIKQTNLNRYGVECVLQNDAIKQKIKETCLERYGTTSALANIEIQEKIRKTNIKRYGVARPLQNKSIQQLCRNTLNERYGVVNLWLIPGVADKIKETHIKKYGVEYAMQNVELWKKQRASAYNNKKYTFPSGREILCQGYEPRALDKLLIDEYIEDDILTEDDIINDLSLPEFWYEKEGRKHRYYPDIYIKSTRTFIEVKSTYTYQMDSEDIKYKVQCVLDRGFNIKTWVFTQKGELTIY